MESYATDMAGAPPRHLKDVLAYLPGGANLPAGRAGVLADGTSLVEIDADPNKLRGMSQVELDNYLGSRVPVGKYWIGVCFWPPNDPRPCGVLGSDDVGKVVAGNAGHTLILSNQ